jgi:hypothetical protein
MSKEEQGPDISWNDQIEELFRQTAEKSNALSMLHSSATQKYQRINTALNIPVIILSTIVGATSMSSTVIFGGWEYGSVIIGVISLFSGILKTVDSYFNYGQLLERHRVTSISYKKLYKILSFELSLPRHQRTNLKTFMKFIKSEMDRLLEQSPELPTDIVDSFNKKYVKIDDIDPEVALPEEVNGLTKVMINKTIQKTKTFYDILGDMGVSGKPSGGGSNILASLPSFAGNNEISDKKDNVVIEIGDNGSKNDSYIVNKDLEKSLINIDKISLTSPDAKSVKVINEIVD